jgi:hypothetical protein
VGEPHVISALVAKRAELAGEIEAVGKRLAQLRADLVHLDAVRRLFDATAEPAAIPAKRPWGGAPAGSATASCRGAFWTRCAPRPRNRWAPGESRSGSWPRGAWKRATAAPWS